MSCALGHFKVRRFYKQILSFATITVLFFCYYGTTKAMFATYKRAPPLLVRTCREKYWSNGLQKKIYNNIYTRFEAKHLHDLGNERNNSYSFPEYLKELQNANILIVGEKH